MPLLEVADLTVSFPTPGGLVQAVRGVSFAVEPKATLAIVGESGSGKSAAALAVLGLASNARVSGRITFEGQDLVGMSPRALRSIRGARIAMVFQDPFSSLHPCHRIGDQVAEVARIHEHVSRRAAWGRAVELLEQVGIPDAGQRARDYPHQFSGGMLQRAVIAMAIALNPRVLIADEPTTALDVTVQAQIIRLLRRLQAERGTALILISHDLGLVAGLADHVMVMYAGRTMEHATRDGLYGAPHHPYTLGLFRSLPRAGVTKAPLTPIPGQPPDAATPPSGCPFHPRCAHAVKRCHADQPFVAVGTSDHQSACWLPVERAT